MFKIAVIFPGIGYHTDKPLLYYSKKLALKEGYEIKDVAYTGFPADVKSSPSKMKEAYESALSQTEKMLEGVDWKQYDEILFISKSVGTAVAASYGTKHQLTTENVYFTPVELSFELMKSYGIVFTGTSDPWVSEGSVEAFCKNAGYPVTIIEHGNHSLETGDMMTDIENLKNIMAKVEEYLKNKS